MATLLYIESSPRKDRSASIQIAQTFVDEYLASHRGDSVDILDLWANEFPPFTGETINAKYAILNGEKPSEAQSRAWRPVEILIDNFKKADKYLFSLPMWNFGIPYKLKHYVDILVQPGYTFSFTPEEGYKGLVTGKPVALVYTRGGAYKAGTEAASLDLQKTYMEQVLGFIGFRDIRSIVAEPMLMSTPEDKKKIIAAAQDEARKMAKAF
ncbi:MAG: NAD(P)H-dependent oxidoreductase [Nitrospiraceae bacterium]|nr:MAG: NAD(P)H-dependent oxidoreductase [Nitrospiraceae bacterium]